MMDWGLRRMRRALRGPGAPRSALLALTVAVCGCGSSGHAGTQVAVQQATAPQASTQPAIGPAGPSSARTPTTPAGAAPQAAPGQAAGESTRGSFQRSAAAGCAAASSAAAAAAPPASPHASARTPTVSAAIRYVTIQRKIAALTSALPPSSLRVLVRRLVFDLTHLQQLYLIGPRNAAGAVGGATATVEREAAALSVAAGVSACSPRQTAQAGLPGGNGTGGQPPPGIPIAPGRPASPGQPVYPGQPAYPGRRVSPGQTVIPGQPASPGAP
jgi:hypothetical protein